MELSLLYSPYAVPRPYLSEASPCAPSACVPPGVPAHVNVSPLNTAFSDLPVHVLSPRGVGTSPVSNKGFLSCRLVDYFAVVGIGDEAAAAAAADLCAGNYPHAAVASTVCVRS